MGEEQEQRAQQPSWLDQPAAAADWLQASGRASCLPATHSFSPSNTAQSRSFQG